ncbi:MAG: class I SAM-dependent methyltransferase [Trueperaceae bacterium]|nr:MAG: class I SAM-dependent methyltransferase [Trueperaceae bacterium]
MIRDDVPAYDELQRQIAEASIGTLVTHNILDLGTGTGITARQVLALHPEAHLTGIDLSEQMLSEARRVLEADRITLLHQALEEPLPAGPFQLVVSALAIHHLDGAGKADLFRRIATVLEPSGRFVMGDLVIPRAPVSRPTPATQGYDRPSTVDDQLLWLQSAGFSAGVVWERGDLAVLEGVKHL